MTNKNWQFETKLIHGGYQGDKETGATVVPIYQTTSFAHDEAKTISDIFNNRQFGYTYSRIANPTVDALESHIKTIEDGFAAAALASGMGATSVALQALLKTGDHIIASTSLFGGTHYLLKELSENHGITITYVEADQTDQYKAAINDQTKLIFAEIIGNPKLDIPDIEGISNLAKEANIPFILDGTSATPYLLNAKKWGVSIIVHSITKWLAGHGNTIGGVVVDLGNFDWKQTKSQAVKTLHDKLGDVAYIARCKKLRSNMGAPLSPMNAFLLETGIDTLALRMQKQCDNAMAVATYLSQHNKVVEVTYPGLKDNAYHARANQLFNNKYGGVLTVKLASKDACYTCIDNLNLIKNLANLGDTKTLVIHPDSTIYRDMTRDEKDAAGATENLIRLSTGIEAADDIIADLKQALDNI